MALSVIEQADFSGGIWQDNAGPANTVADLVDGFVDGTDLVRRGGTSLVLAGAGGALDVMAVSSFTTVGGERTLVQASDGRLWLVAATDGSATQIASGIVPGSRLIGFSNLVAARHTDGRVFVYGGSRRASGPSAVPFDVTNGSARYVSTGQSFTTTADAGMFVGFSNSLMQIASVVALVENNNTLTGTGVSLATASGQNADMYPYFSANVPVGGATSSAFAATALASAGQRLLVFRGGRMYASRSQSAFIEPSSYVDLPTTRVIGAQGLQNNVLVFTANGVFAIQNLAFDLTDDFGNTNWTVSNISQEIILWGDAGLAGIGPQVIVPALDGVYLMAADGSATPIGRGIRDLYRGYVAAGYSPGVAAVHQGHYFLPIMNGSLVVDVLVCRLEGSAWSRWTTDVSAFTVRYPGVAGVAPRLLGGSFADLVDVSGGLRPSVSNTTDHTGVTVPPLKVTTRDLQGRSQGRNLFKYARARYVLSGAVSSPVVGCERALGSGGSSFGSLGTKDGSTPAGSDGEDPVEWLIGERVQTLRLRVSIGGAAGRVSLKNLQVFVRAAGKR